MLVKSILMLAPLFLAAIAEAGNVARSHEDSMVSSADQGLDPRKANACNANGCTCVPGFAGMYCADCMDSNGGYVVTNMGTGGMPGDLYQCDGAGACCNYGASNECTNGATGRCG